MKYQVQTSEGKDTSVVVFFDSGPQNAGSEHPNFKRITEKLRSLHKGETFSQIGLDELRDLFDVSIGIGAAWARLSERVTAHHGQIYLDGDPVHDVLADAIVRFYAADLPEWKPLVLFMEKVVTNPSEHSRDNLYRWMQQCGAFAIDQDGDLIAYKGVGQDFLSGHSGKAFVNGVLINGRIPNQPNTIIEMPRSWVTFDPSNPCSSGLHAASWNYAHTMYGSGHSDRSRTVAMKINPRDVVSVPTDSHDEKMRVCRYHCLGVVKQPIVNALIVSDKRVAKVAKEYDQSQAVPGLPEQSDERVVEGAPLPGKRDIEWGVTEDGHTFPKFFCDYRPQDFKLEPVGNLRWLCGEWEVPKSGNKADLIKRLLARRAWAKRNGR